MDYHAYLLSGVVSLLGQLLASSEAARGGKYTPPKVPMPVTALERVQQRMEDEGHAALIDEVRLAQKRWAAMRRE